MGNIANVHLFSALTVVLHFCERHHLPMTLDATEEPKLVVFSDLDGTLLDHHSYSWAPAKPALDQMKTLGVPLILASSKTAFEIAELRAELGFSQCWAIVENGAGLLPGGEQPREGDGNYAEILDALTHIPANLRALFEGFSDWDVARCAQMTGLSLEGAERAKKRQFSEPGLWSGTEDQRRAFEAALGERGVSARHGGRYLTLSSGATKADQMYGILATYDVRPKTVALGDAPNDVEMISAADNGFIVKNSTGPGIPKMSGEATGKIVRTNLEGPVGWNIAVLDCMAEYYKKEDL